MVYLGIGCRLLPGQRRVARFLLRCIVRSRILRGGGRTQIRGSRATGVVVLADGKLGLELGGIRASDRGTGGVPPWTRTFIGRAGPARGISRGVGAGDGVLGGFLTGLFLRYSRVDSVAKALEGQRG